MTEKIITLRLTMARLEYIGGVLGQRPYAEVAPVLADIQQQLQEQQQQERAQERPAGPSLAAVPSGG